jgi:hypothetical protein
MKLYCDTTRIYPETKLVDPEYYRCNIPAIEGNAETSSEIILTEGYSFPKGRNAIQIIYRTGYKPEEMPENLKRATLELVDWSLKRMRGGQLGVSKEIFLLFLTAQGIVAVPRTVNVCCIETRHALSVPRKTKCGHVYQSGRSTSG